MNEEENLNKINVKPFKDSHIRYSINPDDYVKWLKNPELKEDLDKTTDAYAKVKKFYPKGHPERTITGGAAVVVLCRLQAAEILSKGVQF